MPEFKLITFDADDTLWDFTTMMLRGTEAVATALRGRLGENFAHMTTPEFVHKMQAKEIAKTDPQKVDYIEVRRTTFHGILKQAKHDQAASFADELVDIYLQARNARYEFYPDAYSTLDALRGRFTLGWITNGTTTPDMAGVSHYFDFVITSQTLGLRKPRPEVFHHAAQLAGCETSQMLHVGDEIEADIRGALGVGAGAIWFNPKGRPNPHRLKPLAEVQSLTAVLDWV